MAETFSEDFEGTLSAWTEAGTPTLVAGGGFGATQGLNLNASADEIYHNIVDEATPQEETWCGFWLKTTGTSSSLVELMKFGWGTVRQSRVMLKNSTGQMTVQGVSGDLDSVADAGVVDNEWHYIEVYAKNANNPNGKVIVHVDGLEILNGTGDTRATGAVNTRITLSGNTATNVRVFDDFYIDHAEFHGVPAVASTGRIRGMSVHRVDLTTNAAGVVTAYSSGKVNGKVARVWVDIGTLADSTTTDIVVTGERTAEAIYTGTNLTADTLTDPTTAAGVYIWRERIKVVVAQGGDTKIGQIWFVVIG